LTQPDLTTKTTTTTTTAELTSTTIPIVGNTEHLAIIIGSVVVAVLLIGLCGFRGRHIFRGFSKKNRPAKNNKF
jgi:hypothetical protein